MRMLFLSALFFLSGFNLPQGLAVRLEMVCDGLISPVAMAYFPDGSNRLLICEQYGMIKIVQNGMVQTTPFLDIRNKIIPQSGNYSERGLLGLAFHPKFESNHKFYVYYSAVSNTSGFNHKSVISEFKMSSFPGRADASSERIVLEIEQPESNHNGGELAFGPDGYLYIGSGDGGGAGDRHGTTGNGQNLETLLGKILRIDVNSTSGYKIPPDNPFVNKPGRDEIWAYGLRNPWKFSFDQPTGRLFCADVGQDSYEEIDLITKGGNYGWRIMEGAHCFNPKTKCNTKTLILPIAEYPHSEGICVIGGYVYRGSSKMYTGNYFFTDWTGKLFRISQGIGNNPVWVKERVLINELPDQTYFNSMGKDAQGNLYILGMTGTGPQKNTGALYKIVF